MTVMFIIERRRLNNIYHLMFCQNTVLSVN